MSILSKAPLLVSVSLLTVACTSAAPGTNTSTSSGVAAPTQTAPTQTAPTQAPTSTARPQTPGPQALEGTWSSAACGSRKYPRELTLNADGTFTSQDLVSPCPANVQCVWSGIVNNDGKWKRQGTGVVLEPSAPGKPPGEPLVTTLTFDDTALSEPGSEKTCVYARK